MVNIRTIISGQPGHELSRFFYMEGRTDIDFHRLCCLWGKKKHEGSTSLEKFDQSSSSDWQDEVKGKQTHTHSLRSFSVSVWKLWGGTSPSDVQHDLVHTHWLLTWTWDSTPPLPHCHNAPLIIRFLIPVTHIFGINLRAAGRNECTFKVKGAFVWQDLNKLHILQLVRRNESRNVKEN